MNQNFPPEIAKDQNEISRLACQLWEKAGSPEGRDLEFWLAAETQLVTLQSPEAAKVETVVAKPSFGSRRLASPLQGRTTPVRHL